MRQKQTGFTIVELLIVIVVIAILAAITVVAFNGIQQRAKVTQIQSAVSTHSKVLRMYLIQSGAYPAGLTSAACFDGTATCWAGATQANTDTLTAALSQISSSYPTQPAPSGTVLANGTTTDTTKGGNYTGWYIAYTVPVGATCPNISGGYFLNSSAGTGNLICRTAMPVEL